MLKGSRQPCDEHGVSEGTPKRGVINSSAGRPLIKFMLPRLVFEDCMGGIHDKFHPDCAVDKCPEKDCEGTLFAVRQYDCYCHLFPPCSACVSAPLICNVCYLEIESDA